MDEPAVIMAIIALGVLVASAQALKFARSENGKNPQAVIVVPGVLELDMSRTSRSTQLPQFSAAGAQTVLQQVA